VLEEGAACVHLHGKGRKLRSVPLWRSTVKAVRAWLKLNPQFVAVSALLPNRDDHELSRSPDTATVEDLRRYQLHLVDHGISPISLNAAITGLKFFYEITLEHAELMARMQPVRIPRRHRTTLNKGLNRSRGSWHSDPASEGG